MAPAKKPSGPRRQNRGEALASGSSPKKVPKNPARRKPAAKQEEETPAPEPVKREEVIGGIEQQLMEGRRLGLRGRKKPSREDEGYKGNSMVSIEVPADEAHLFQRWIKWNLHDWSAAFCREIKRGDYDDTLEEIQNAIHERNNELGIGEWGADEDIVPEEEELKLVNRSFLLKGSFFQIIAGRAYNGVIGRVDRLNAKTITATALTGNQAGRQIRVPYSCAYELTSIQEVFVKQLPAGKP
jgi:hypothetical protein